MGLCTIEDIEAIDVDTAITLYLIFSASVPTFVFCYLSENFTKDLSDVGNTFFSSAWYRLPTKNQRSVAQAIHLSQRSFRLTGYQIVNCSLQVFSSVRGHENCVGIEFSVNFNYNLLRITYR